MQVKKMMVIQQPSAHQIFNAGRDVINLMHPPHHTALVAGELFCICSGDFDPLYVKRNGEVDWEKIFLSYDFLGLPIPKAEDFDIGFIHGIVEFKGCEINGISMWAIDYEFHHWMVTPIKEISPKIPMKQLYRHKVRSAQYVLNCTSYEF